MALRIDLTKASLDDCINMKINSLKRANTNEVNPMIKEIREKDIAALTTAMNTSTEIK